MASYTIPGPKTGFMNPYTSFWERTSSDALKNGSCASGPIRKVNRLCKNCIFFVFGFIFVLFCFVCCYYHYCVEDGMSERKRKW